MKKRALITGITGQDGSYLAELLINKGYSVHGLVRRVAAEDWFHRYWRIKHLVNKINIHLKMNFPQLIQILMVRIFYYLQLKNSLLKQNFTLPDLLKCLEK